MLKRLVLLAMLICNYNVFAQNSLQYPFAAFNSDTCCWRKLSAEGKYIAGANLIVAYMAANKNARGQNANWHTGQLFAMGGDKQQAKKYFKKTYSVFQKWFGGKDGAAWYYFAKGTEAFVVRDKDKLQHIIRKWERKYPQDGNYKELTKLYANWDKPYSEAYK